MSLKFSKIKRDYTFMDLKYDQATAIRRNNTSFNEIGLQKAESFMLKFVKTQVLQQNGHVLTYSEDNSQPIQV